MPRHRAHKQRGYDNDDPVDPSLLAATSRSLPASSSPGGTTTSVEASANRSHREDPNSTISGPNYKRTTEHTQSHGGDSAMSNGDEGMPMLMEEENVSVGLVLTRERNKERDRTSAKPTNSNNYLSVSSSQDDHRQSIGEIFRAVDALPNLLGVAEPAHLLSNDIGNGVLDGSISVTPVAVNIDSNFSERPEIDDPTAVVAEPFDANRLRMSIQNQIFNDATPAEELYREAEIIKLQEQQREAELQQRRRFRRRVIFLVVLFMVVIIVVIVVVLLSAGKNNKSPSTPSFPIASPTLSPSFARKTARPVAPPQYLPTDLNQNDAQGTIFGILEAGVNHTLMTTYLSRANLMGNLDTNQLCTVFAPTDASWRTFAASSVSYAYYVNASNAYWTHHLTFLMQYHIVPQSWQLSDLLRLFQLPTAADGVILKVSQSDGQVGDNSAIIITADIPAFNGYINVPNKVLVESRLSKTILQQVVNRTQTSTQFKLQTLADIIVTMKDIDSLFLGSLEQNSVTGLTLLAPADDAFTLASWTSNVYNTAGNATLTRRFIENHIIEFNLYSLQVPSLLTTLSGFSLWLVNDDKNNTFCNGARVRKSDYVQNGVVAVIDRVLFPPNWKELLEISTNVTESYKFDTFLNVTEEVAQLGNLLTDEGNYVTILAPLEEAFDRDASSYKLVTRWLGVGWLLHQQSLIRHHFTSQTIPTQEGQYSIPTLSGYNSSVIVQSNGTLIVNNVSSEFVKNGPLRSTNGLIYFLKGVLVPPWGYHSVDEALGQHSELNELSTLMNTHNFTTVLSGTGPITLLAPSNSALRALNASSLGSSALRTILLGHILDGNKYSKLLGSNVTAVTALNNRTWQVSLVSGSHVTVGGGLITTPDLLANNGVIHIIDKVLGLS